MKKLILLFLMFSYHHIGHSQDLDCSDYQIIQLQDSIVSGYPHLYFRMTTNSNNINSGYSDFVFIDQNGDSITSLTGWSIWLPESNNSAFDTTDYILNFNPGISSFPLDFDGYLEILNPNCTVPFSYLSLSTPLIDQSETSIDVYPNPSNDKLYISTYASADIEYVQVYNMNGELFSMDMSANNYLDISHLSKGIYLVKIYSNQTYRTVKILKN